MLTFYRSGRYGDLGDVSPYVYKLETYMRMARVPFDTKLMPVDQMLMSGPRNLIPFIDEDGERMGDSSLIIEHFQKLHGDGLGDLALPDELKYRAHLIKKLLENDMFYIMIYSRWLGGADYKTFAKFVNRHRSGDELAFAVDRSLESVKAMLHGFRMGRYEETVVEGFLRENLDCLTYWLGDQRYFLGDQPHAVDAGAFSQLASFIHFPIDNPLAKVAKSYTSLVAYCDRMKAEFYPPDAWADSL